MINWEQLLAVYGPLGLVLAYMLKAHHDIVYKTIPEAIQALSKEMRKGRVAQQRLAQAFLLFEAKSDKQTQRRKSNARTKAAKVKAGKTKRKPV